MMDVTLTDLRDVCKYYYNKYDCGNCPLYELDNANKITSCIIDNKTTNTELSLICDAICKWKKEHKRTQYEDLKTHYPNYTRLPNSDIPDICPKSIDNTHTCKEQDTIFCKKCKINYWSQVTIK